MARGRSRYQRGRVVATEGGGWEIHYNIYLTDPTIGKPKRHHRSRVVGYKPKIHRADAEKIWGAELATPIHPDNWLRLRLYPGREKTGDRISSYVSGAPQELLHAWQEGSKPDRDAGPTRTQRHPYYPGHLYPDYRPGSG
jgi:hypothetical protein